VTEHSPGPSVGLPVRLSAKCIVAKRPSGSGCRLGGEWGQSRDGCIRWGSDRRRGRGSFGDESGASNCNQWGLCDAALPKLLWAGLVLMSFCARMCLLGVHWQIQYFRKGKHMKSTEPLESGAFWLRDVFSRTRRVIY